MNRQIKFRGKRLDLNIWMYGDLLQYNEGSVAIGTHGRYTDDGYSFNDCWNETPYVDEDTVGQYTGLHDKNGKEIYEGDIITVKGLRPRVVLWDKMSWALMPCEYYQDTHFWIMNLQHPGNDWWEEYSDEMEVVGNIHDNSELLNPPKP